MRLGAHVFDYEPTAAGYTAALKAKKYTAAYVPAYLKSSSQTEEAKALADALGEADIVLSEVGTWCNPLSPNQEEASAARAYIIDRIRLADEIGARCCVNVIGSASSVHWFAPCAENFTTAFFDHAVRVYQNIIDEADPQHTKFAFELMPYCFLDGPDPYLEFLDAVNRPEQTAVHLDFVNLIHDPRTLYGHRELFAQAAEKLGSRVVSAHLKDIMIEPTPMNTVLREVLPGTGEVDLPFALECLAALPGDLPVMLEHLDTELQYDSAAIAVRLAAKEAGVELK